MMEDSVGLQRSRKVIPSLSHLAFASAFSTFSLLARALSVPVLLYLSFSGQVPQFLRCFWIGWDVHLKWTSSVMMHFLLFFGKQGETFW